LINLFSQESRKLYTLYDVKYLKIKMHNGHGCWYNRNDLITDLQENTLTLLNVKNLHLNVGQFASEKIPAAFDQLYVPPIGIAYKGFSTNLSQKLKYFLSTLF